MDVEHLCLAPLYYLVLGTPNLFPQYRRAMSKARHFAMSDGETSHALPMFPTFMF